MYTLEVLSIICVIATTSVRAEDTMWDNDIFSGRQWIDYLTPTIESTHITHTAAVLLLYTPECFDQYKKLDLSDGLKPPRQYLIFGKHDCETFPNHIWYHIDAKDNICELYNYEELECGTYLYFEKGSDINKPTEIYHPNKNDMDVLEWMWSKLAMNISVVNARHESILISRNGRGQKLPPLVLGDGERGTMLAFESYVLLVQDEGEGDLILGKVLDKFTNGKTIMISYKTNMNGQTNARKWYKKRDNEIQVKSRELRNWRWGVAAIYLMDFKQPPLLPKFTELGYKKGTMPAGMYQKVLSWYKDHIDTNRTKEYFDVEPAINDSEVKCSMVHLSEEMKKYIGDIMKPYLERWVNMSLVQTRLYGVREYYHGNILRNHVDRITTHVVSVILQIDKELDGGKDWELEVIGLDGYRKNVT